MWLPASKLTSKTTEETRGELYIKVYPDQIRLPLSHLTLKPVKIEAQKQVRDPRGLVLNSEFCLVLKIIEEMPQSQRKGSLWQRFECSQSMHLPQEPHRRYSQDIPINKDVHSDKDSTSSQPMHSPEEPWSRYCTKSTTNELRVHELKNNQGDTIMP